MTTCSHRAARLAVVLAFLLVTTGCRSVDPSPRHDQFFKSIQNRAQKLGPSVVLPIEVQGDDLRKGTLHTRSGKWTELKKIME